MTARNCSFKHFKEYAIRLETEKYLHSSEMRYGGPELLENVSEISLQDCKFEANGKGDVALKPGTAFGLTTKQDGTMNMES